MLTETVRDAHTYRVYSYEKNPCDFFLDDDYVVVLLVSLSNREFRSSIVRLVSAFVPSSIPTENASVKKIVMDGKRWLRVVWGSSRKSSNDRVFETLKKALF